jgi:thioredoxin 2
MPGGATIARSRAPRPMIGDRPMAAPETANTTAEALHVVCPHCDTVNRVPRQRLSAGGRCGECHRPLFAGEPVALDAERFARHLEKSDVPLLIDFWAEWCGPCRAMAPEFARAAARLEPRLRLVKLDVDAAPDIAQRFAVRSIPTLALALHGREIARIAGARSAADLERWALEQLASVQRAP